MKEEAELRQLNDDIDRRTRELLRLQQERVRKVLALSAKRYALTVASLSHDVDRPD